MAGTLTTTWVWTCVYDDCTTKIGCCIGPPPGIGYLCSGPFTGPDGVSNDCPDYRQGEQGQFAKKIWQGSIIVEGPCFGGEGTSDRNRALAAQVDNVLKSNCFPCCPPPGFNRNRCISERYCREIGGTPRPEWMDTNPKPCRRTIFTGEQLFDDSFTASCTPGACCYRQPPFVTDGVCTEVQDTYRDCTYKGSGYSASPGLTCEQQTDNRCKPFCCQDVSPVCTHDYTANQCLARPGGEVVPNGMDCDSRIPIYAGGEQVTTVRVCDIYACCLPNGTCQSRMRASKCQAAGGTVIKGTLDCLPGTCFKGCCLCGVCKDVESGVCTSLGGQTMPAKCAETEEGIVPPLGSPDRLYDVCRRNFFSANGARPPCKKADLITYPVFLEPTLPNNPRFRWRTKEKVVTNLYGSNQCNYHKAKTVRQSRSEYGGLGPTPQGFVPVICNRWHVYQNQPNDPSFYQGPDYNRLYRKARIRHTDGRFYWRAGYRQPCKSFSTA